MESENSQQNLDLLNHVAKILTEDQAVFDDQIELIMGVLMIILEHTWVKDKFNLVLSKQLTTEIEGTTLDKICAVINKTHLMVGESATINDDTALELISEYLVEYDEFIFYKNKKRLLRKAKPGKIKKHRGANYGNEF